jgi:hypothetical protein
VKLDIGSRIRLLGILPEKGNLLTLKIVRTLRDDLSFSEKEHKDFGIKVQSDRITWDDKAKSKNIDFGAEALKIVEDSLKELNEKDELTVPDLALWEKFIGKV